MFARRERLRSSRDIESVLKRGKRYSTVSLMIWVVERQNGPLRVSVMCSKKVDRRAVIRNKVKRRVREAIRAVLATHDLSLDIVVSAKPQAKESTTSDFRGLFSNVFHIQ